MLVTVLLEYFLTKYIWFSSRDWFVIYGSWDTPNQINVLDSSAMESCGSDYEPSSAVEAFHDIPHFDIDLNELNSTYESSVDDYFEVSITWSPWANFTVMLPLQAIIIWSCVPVLVGIALIILMLVVWGISCCCIRWKKKEQPTTYREPSRCLKGVLVTLLLTCALAGV